jgi:predicted permease
LHKSLPLLKNITSQTFVWSGSMDQFVFSLGIIFSGFTLGYVIQILIRKKVISVPYDIDVMRKALQSIALLFFSPVATLGAIWILNFDDLKIVTLPFIGIMTLLLGGVLAFLFSKMLRMSRKQTGAYIVSGGFSNLGAIGGLICYAFLGEPGFALVTIYRLFEDFGYYAFGFPIAKSFSLSAGQTESIPTRIKKIFLDPFVLVSIVSLAAGTLLNISNIERPDFYTPLNAVFVPVMTILLLTSIGMAMRFDLAGRYLKEGALIALIKFVLLPVLATSVAYLLGFGEIDGGLPLKVVMILSSMPVAFTALVPPTIFDLDIDLPAAPGSPGSALNCAAFSLRIR